ncbi:MAG: FAD-dependent oxidoreductase [Deltaproteobacteria bacterium]|jgi:NADPH-dependent 2,4-dienoyl-CoA reductase/sulfur reductase-like enzyme|nr:FAD-dependent oxidoreductase [Deltaproteobacteria bacterium]
MPKDRIVIIGGDAAGMSAASKIRRMRPDQAILVFERTDFTSYSACGIPYFIGGLIDDVDQLIARNPETFRDKYGIEVRTQHEVVAIDPQSQRITVRSRKNCEFTEAYDQLLIATGARPFCPDVPGANSSGIFGLSTLASGIRVREFLVNHQPKQAVVVGGGYIGLEMAEALIRQKLKVSLVQRSSQVMGTLDPDMGALVSKALKDVGVTLYLSERLEGFETSCGRVTGVVTDLRTLPADLVILGMGVRPNSELAGKAGVSLGEKDAIKVDNRMRTETENIWAAGDCVATLNRITGKPTYVALGTVANKQGVVAGMNLAGGDSQFPGVVGTAVSKICKVEVARSGLQEKELKALGYEYAVATIDAKTRAGYFPGAGPITVKLLGEKNSGRLLGAQIVGMEGAAKRIDTIATALTARMTVKDLVDLDLSYAPPFSPVWDPVQIAARKLVKTL